MSVFGISDELDQYCEHFDVLHNIGKLIDKTAIVIFLVNKKPFFHFSNIKKEVQLKPSCIIKLPIY